ncbi:hypothetical protein [Vibrio cholerae]|uniref:hypothetical protein n=1 Tax=Vibrio cholerae TaxID=666 RepID=UPI00207FEE8E|nr:hypothetical protein [Vibrio cholerae]GIB54920.1 hypothetical protein VCSRO140_1944 [Vibrio cholerae]
MKINSLILLLLFTPFVYSKNIVSKVKYVGCHIDTNTCFVYIESEITTSCTANDKSLRWNGESNTNGKSVLSILLSAQVSGKPITFSVKGCYDNYPSFNWLAIGD